MHEKDGEFLNTSKSIYRLLVIIIVVTTLIGVLLALYLLKANEAADAEIVLNGSEQKSMAVQLSDMNPGSKRKYTVKTELVAGDIYNMQIRFQRTDEGELAEYIALDVKYGGTVIASGRLSDFLNGKTLEFQFEVSEEKNCAFELIYKMDVEAGNEAQGTFAGFEVTMSITR